MTDDETKELWRIKIAIYFMAELLKTGNHKGSDLMAEISVKSTDALMKALEESGGSK